MSNLIKKVVTGVSSVALAASMLISPVAMNVTHAASAGEVYKSTDGTVWFIDSSMHRRAFTSFGAFQSYGFLSASQIKDADASVTALSTGDFIAPQDGRIFCATATKGTDVSGECSLITGSKKAAFTSATVFGGQGYSFSRAFYGDSSFLDKTSNIENASAQHRPGTLINNNGTVQLVVTGGLWGVPSMDVFNSWGWSFADVVPANSADVLLAQIGIIPARQAGQLVPTGNADVNPTPGDCTDGEGTVDTFSNGSAEDTTVHENASDVELVAYDVELADDGCLAMDRFDLIMGQATASDSDKPWDYFTDAHLMVNGDEVASMSVDSSSDWSDYAAASAGTLGNGAHKEYRLRFSGLDAVLAGNETADISVSFDTVNNLDSADTDAVWYFGTETDSFRFTDGTGFTFTDGSNLEGSFAFEGADEAAITISSSVDNPDSRVIEVDDTTDTNGEVVGAFELENTENVDANITTMTVALSETGTAAAVNNVFKKLYLYDGSTLVGQENVTGATVTFDNLDLDVNGDDTVTLTVKADFDDTNDQARFANGQLVAITDVDVTELTDEMDNDEGDIAVTGTYASNSFELRSEGINLELVSARTTATRTFVADTAGADIGTFVITFEATAFGDDMYIDASPDVGTLDCAAEADAAGQGVEYCLSTTTAATMSAGSHIVESPTTESKDIADAFWIAEGETREFSITYVGAPSADTQTQMRLESVNWADASTAEAAGGVIDADFTNYYNFDLGDYKTPYLFLNFVS